MKTNVSIELNDEQRNRLAILIDGKESKRMATRKEVVELCQRHIGGLAEASEPAKVQIERNQDAHAAFISLKPDPEDVALMAQPNNPSYVRGWNQVKRSKR